MICSYLSLKENFFSNWSINLFFISVYDWFCKDFRFSINWYRLWLILVFNFQICFVPSFGSYDPLDSLSGDLVILSSTINEPTVYFPLKVVFITFVFGWLMYSFIFLRSVSSSTTIEATAVFLNSFLYISLSFVKIYNCLFFNGPKGC